MRKFQLYIVPTPVGNIKDITLRAIDVLKEVDLIACEDSRVTQKLLNHYEIKTKCISYHKYNEKERLNLLSDYIKEGKTIALVSDAGTPMICDPGYVLINELLKQGVSINALPGACVIPTFLSAVPRETEDFLFIGFIGKTEKQITETFKKYSGMNLLFYDSPNRIVKTLEYLEIVRPDAKVAVGRELTKLFETIVIKDVKTAIKEVEPKGEFVCFVYKDEKGQTDDLDLKIKTLKDKGYGAKDITTILTSLYPDFNKNEVYKKTL